MELLERRILSDGRVLPGGILKVDGFLNHQIDPALLYEMALELKRIYAGEQVTKVLTIEASGIAIAALVGYVFGCPLVFAKKSKSKNISSDVYSVEVESFTHGNTNTVVVSKEYLKKEDRVLIIDDFLAEGAGGAGRSHSGGSRYCHRKGFPGRGRSAPLSGNAHRVPGPYRFHGRR